jgi:hypothetical protein
MRKKNGRPRRFNRVTAREIRRLVKSGQSAKEVAVEYGTSIFTITQVVKAIGAYANTR